MVDSTVLPASTVALTPLVTCLPRDGFFFLGAGAGASASAMVASRKSMGDCGASVESEPQAPRPQVRPHRGGSASSLPAGLSRGSIVLSGVWGRVGIAFGLPQQRQNLNLGLISRVLIPHTNGVERVESRDLWHKT